MRRSIRKRAGLACGAVFASAAMAVSTATGASAVTTAVAIGGLGTPDMHEIVINPLLGGKLARENDILDGVEWPAEAKRPGTGQTLGQSITVGITNLGTHFDAAFARLEAGEQFTVVGFSAGSLVVNDFMRELANDPDAPTKDQVKFILVADSSRQKLLNETSKYNPQYDYTYRPAPQTMYDIDVVTGEYDGAADLPDRWWNFLALANAIAGGLFVHVPMMFSDYEAVTPEENITRVTNTLGGTTTTYLVPTKTLPLVQLLPFLKSQEASLKAKIDAGYSRNDDRLAAAAAATSTARSLAAPTVTNEATDEVADDEAVATVQKISTDSDAEQADVPAERTSSKPAVDDAADDDEAAANEDAEADAADAKVDAKEDAEAAVKDDADASAGTNDDGEEGADSGSNDSAAAAGDTDSSDGSSSEGPGSSDSGSSE
ncbi:PE-PPE domain-containing protein [Mycolicibacterium sp. PAM1]|uniref:PE-PPE, C-terminal domain protein n=1 Tax=Mycolicibacterium gilvum (strain PYR-GCK) TaxID=350054 RepID=A4TAB9_MYCGI|nr:PE-PPE domain-containing protein [Mycolicibacterium sp. PAM1]ABP45847.1 PE-PPE, C-terminal domain protein [Mycolicibacterium gilvum PYR-GCK]MBV5243538.1 PE-PPE domain-containing protein [Mycolicibacterium sp. PAM1]